MSELKIKSGEFSRKQLNKIYNDALSGKIKDSRLSHIQKEICMTVPYIQYSPAGMKSLIDVLNYCYSEGKLEYYNSRLLDFVKDNSIDKDKIPGCFIGSVFAFLYEGPRPKVDEGVNYYYLEQFSSFALMGNLDVVNDTDYSKMKEINFDLASLIEFNSRIKESQNKNVSAENRLRYSNMISELQKHIMMYIYFNLEKYNYNYELYAVAMEDIFENFEGYLEYICQYSEELFKNLNIPFRCYDINDHSDRQVLEELIHLVIRIVEHNNQKCCVKERNGKARILAI